MISSGFLMGFLVETYPVTHKRTCRIDDFIRILIGFFSEHVLFLGFHMTQHIAAKPRI
jgi:hypothetical protein